MAELKYSKDGRLLFTKEMKKNYTLLAPMMLPIHFGLIQTAFGLGGYKVEILDTTGHEVVNEGLRSVHNDSCYPAILVVGQLINAVKSGKYDTDQIGLLITQTGGGCRASNYIHLLRKGLLRAGYTHIPVVSLNLSGLEKNPGFKLTIPLLIRLILSVIYGDILMLLANQCRPYEVAKGEADRLVQVWSKRLADEFKSPSALSRKRIKNNLTQIVRDFAKIQRIKEPKIRVGVVGEIYVKYSPLGNNGLEEFLQNEGAEVVVPGLLDFLIFKTDNRAVDVELYGGNPLKRILANGLAGYMKSLQKAMIEAIEENSDFRPPATFDHIKSLVKGYVGYGNKMGEGWLLTGEMLELIESGAPNIVCTQPFGCLPNHIAGKGMLRKIKDLNPEANIVAIDYDPGATKINQENRIKLMLANARKAAEAARTEKKGEKQAPATPSAHS